MRYKWPLSIFILFVTTTSPAAVLFDAPDICSRITGSWYGTFTLKNNQDCRLYHGCTHGLTIHVNHHDGAAYQADVTPQAGQHGSFLINCEKGKITSPSHPSSTIELNCPDATICTVKYDDEKQNASLIGAGID